MNVTPHDFVVGDTVVLTRSVRAGSDDYAKGTSHEITSIDDVAYPYLLDGEYRVPAEQIKLAFESRYCSQRLERRLGELCGLESLGHLLGIMLTQREIEVDPEDLIAWAAEHCDMIWDDVVAPALDKIERLHDLHLEEQSMMQS